MIIIQTDKQTIFDFPSQIATAVTSTYQHHSSVYYKPPLTFFHFSLKSFPTFYSLVRSVLNWPRQPNSAAKRSLLRFVNPFNLRTSTYHRLILLFCNFLIISKFSLLIWEVIGTSWPFCMKEPLISVWLNLWAPDKRQSFDCAMYGQNFDHHLDRADFGHPTFSKAYGQIWTLTCVHVCGQIWKVWLQLV